MSRITGSTSCPARSLGALQKVQAEWRASLREASAQRLDISIGAYIFAPACVTIFAEEPGMHHG
jgi:hypothetical protein